ncbi:T-complex protein 1 subunit delta [Candida albicans L26]|uniref:T-complex protein 1 subunit delta n=3 Tax=Candida albicans TaxID=5476 RepID=A0A1D8PLN3_CANAL|nr:chaperonin-containing T-complex subunit [Candida albicans SC5314]EEQ45206.1 T-complex protein 1 subunit delta [Candida albicans WO-1]KGQ86530.1 T-complex protein 1 subunit delta [Candida albicans P94015]KGQ89583.1 T-complex protein 1 subunit delta [Candida albicans P37005]KGR15045.1 T-complex protein 1 subunit delta [Candida albicans P37037]KGT68509.1 T-complex protein 1 subunit delta [Candida albicans 12C]KGU09252.1 T-complex protein 1 subunit delta [Candida albicans 19F]KGU09752.1 T-com|eukprot:XP_720470.1 chaperonin-containing T-complex subunit [Candida albicans SC5314]
MASVARPAVAPSNATFKDKEKPQEVRKANILAARAVSDAIRTSLGPKGMDKMIRTKNGEIIISNDGATILKHMAVLHPAARMLVDVSHAQDVEAGDGTTTVAILTGAFLGAAERLLSKGIHPTLIAESFQRAAQRSVEILLDMSYKISLDNREQLIRAATTSLSSKIVSQHSQLLAPLAVDSVLKVINEEEISSGPDETITKKNVDLNDIRLIKKVGGTIDDTHLVNGIVLTQNVVKHAGGPVRVEKAKIGLIQFQISPPKPDMENNVVVNDYRQMDKILKEERAYLLNICKKIKKAKCNVLLIQKSILRDAVNDLALHFLSKLNIMVIKDIERDEVEFLSKAIGCKPIADIDNFTEDRLGTADLIEELDSSGSKIVEITGVTSKNIKPTVSVIIRGANNLVLDETERSLHDALCVIRCLVKQQALIAGGGAPEIEVSRQLMKEANKLSGVEQFVYKEFAQALEVIPTTLAENAGLNPINVVTDLRNRHENGEKDAGISVRRSGASNTYDEHVLQPVLVSTSAIVLASECVKSILRIDDIQFSR